MKQNDENYVYYLVSQNLKRLRKEHKLTQEKLAILANYCPGFITNIESKKYHQTFSLGTLWGLAQVLEVDIREFFTPLKDNSQG